jgi:TetR/AcrR family transcriptional regulator, repressor of the mexAB-oprM multidrug resistance operon
MPRNRQQIPREERTEELLTAATELFLKHGYAGTTMAEISAAAGVAPANVYWYFPSKDDIFAAVMDRMLRRETRALDHELRDVDPLSALLRGLSDMRAFRSLHRSMHHRMQESDPVKESHDRFMAWIRTNVERVLAQNRDVADPAMICDIVVSLFEGATVSSESGMRPARDMIVFTLKALLPEKAAVVES